MTRYEMFFWIVAACLLAGVVAWESKQPDMPQCFEDEVIIVDGGSRYCEPKDNIGGAM